MKTYFFVLNGMLSTPNTWSWQFALVLIILLSLMAPLSSNNRVRYYACYICYVFNVSLMAIILIPFFMFRPKNIGNLWIAGKICKHITKFIGITWTLRNGHILEEQKGAVITANHQSILDVMGMFNIWETMGKCTAIAKKELLYIPPFGQAAWLAGLVFIDRSNPTAALQTIQMSSHIIHDLKAKLWLYPEGTRNKNGEKLLPFKRGAFKSAIDSRAPIIPVVFSPYYFIDGRNKTFNRGEIIISVLDEVSTEGLQPEDTNELMKKVHDLMSAEYDKLKQEIEIKYRLKK
uniref:1-acyl-sn-glycerol-3-phosphate acyltransferase n=1 Tax=Lygus hesperus TaxID=30085 RepID=A0A0A9WN79_LYGHE